MPNQFCSSTLLIVLKFIYLSSPLPGWPLRPLGSVSVHWFIMITRSVCMSLSTKHFHGEIYSWSPHDWEYYSVQHKQEHASIWGLYETLIHRPLVCLELPRYLNMCGGVSSNEDEMHASNPAIRMFYKLFYRPCQDEYSGAPSTWGNMQPFQPTFITINQSLYKPQILIEYIWSLTCNMRAGSRLHYHDARSRAWQNKGLLKPWAVYPGAMLVISLKLWVGLKFCIGNHWFIKILPSY